MDVVNETVLRNGSWFAEKPGNTKWENPWTQIGINEDGYPKYIVRAFEIANKHAPNVKLVYNHNGGMEKVMWEKVIETIAYLLEGECTLFYGEKLEHHILVRKGEQIFIPENVPHTPYNQSKNECIWVVVHSSGDDQDELISMPELTKELDKYKSKSKVRSVKIKSKTSNILSRQNLQRKTE